MPPKNAKKKAAVGTSSSSSTTTTSTLTAKQLAIEDAEIDEQLLKIDIWIDNVRKDIESIFEPAVEEARREISSMLIRLSSRVKNMKMSDFLRECGGDVDALLAKDKRQQKMARTAARHVAGGGIGSTLFGASGSGSGVLGRGGGGSSSATSSIRAGMTAAKPLARASRINLPAIFGEVDGTGDAAIAAAIGRVSSSSSSSSGTTSPTKALPVSSSSSSSSSLPLVTPGHAPARSRMLIGAGGGGTAAINAHVSDHPAAKTPAMALMRSSAVPLNAMGGGGGGGVSAARTPSVSAFLPKTPGAVLMARAAAAAATGNGAATAAGTEVEGKRARVKRRNEMVYHVAVSENGSPILEDSRRMMGGNSATAAVNIAASAAISSTSTTTSAASATSTAMTMTAGGAIQIAVGDKAVVLDDEAKAVEALAEGDDAEMMLTALEALQARVAAVREKVAEKAAAKAAAAAAAALAGI